jgi:homoserine kinase
MNITIKVPATSANLGPGFDTLGLALDLWNETEFSTDSITDASQRMGTDVVNGLGTDARIRERIAFGETDGRIVVSVEGEGAGKISNGKDNLIVEAAMKLAELAGKDLPPFKLSCVNHIPMGSGLGSSSAAILTGMLGANELLGEPFSRDEILTIAAEMEGHADNVSPALLGGLTLSSVDVEADKVIVRQIPIGMDLHITVVLPDFHLPTKEARAALPKHFSMKDAVHNISHAALVLEAFRCGDLDLLGEAMTDTLHQPYRLKLIPGAESAMEAARQAGAAAVALSGAGPSLIAFSSKAEAGIGESMKRAYETAGLKARIFNLRVSGRGAEIHNG